MDVASAVNSLLKLAKAGPIDTLEYSESLALFNLTFVGKIVESRPMAIVSRDIRGKNSHHVMFPADGKVVLGRSSARVPMKENPNYTIE